MLDRLRFYQMDRGEAMVVEPIEQNSPNYPRRLGVVGVQTLNNWRCIIAG